MVSEGSPALQHSQHAGTCARPLSAPPGHPAHGHTTHAPAAGTRCAGGCHPPRGSCRSPQQPGWRVAAPGLPGGRPSPPATPQPPLVSIAPASWGGERWGVRGWRQQGHPAGFGETGTAGDGDVDFPPMLLFFSFCFSFFLFWSPPVKPPRGVHTKHLPGAGTGARQGHVRPHLAVLHTWRDTQRGVSPACHPWGPAARGELGRTGPSWGWAMGSFRSRLARGHPMLWGCISGREGTCRVGTDVVWSVPFLGVPPCPHAGRAVPCCSRGCSPSSPQPSGTAREADARAAARNTITLPRPRVGLCIWGGREGKESELSQRWDLHPCGTMRPAPAPHPLLVGTAG